MMDTGRPDLLTRRSHTVGVILSAGVGSRFHSPTPKQYIKLAGRMIVEHTIQAFESSPDVDEIIIVAGVEHVELLWACASRCRWIKVSKIVAGGSDRFGSTLSALTALKRSDATDFLVIHDAVRPLVSQRILRDCVRALHDFGACDVVIPSADTIVQVDDTGCICSIPSRVTLRRGQTPQAFRYGVLLAAYQKAVAAGRRDFTCDCGVVRAMLPAERVVTVEGDESNIKITTQSDLFLGEKLIQTRSTHQEASHPISENRLQAGLEGRVVVVVGGTAGIGKAVAELCTLSAASVEVCSRSTGVDVVDYSSLVNFIEQVQKKHGRIDYVVNTSGRLLYKPLAMMSQQEVKESIDVNYLGAVNVARAAVGALQRTSGCLVMFTSSSYTRGRPFYSLYSSSKCAIVNLAQALSEEWAEQGIRVLCMNPERTNTRMRRETFGDEPAGTLLDPSQVAEQTLLAMARLSGGVVDVRNTAISVSLGGAP